MMHYIPVTTETGKLLYINLDRVNVVAQDGNGSYFEFVDGSITRCCQTMAVVGEMIDNANRQLTIYAGR